MLYREEFSRLSDNEFKLLSNLVAAKRSMGGIVEPYFDGDGYNSLEERNEGYKNLKKLGYIYFDDKVLLKKNILSPNDIRVLFPI